MRDLRAPGTKTPLNRPDVNDMLEISSNAFQSFESFFLGKQMNHLHLYASYLDVSQTPVLTWEERTESVSQR